MSLLHARNVGVVTRRRPTCIDPRADVFCAIAEAESPANRSKLVAPPPRADLAYHLRRPLLFSNGELCVSEKLMRVGMGVAPLDEREATLMNPPDRTRRIRGASS